MKHLIVVLLSCLFILGACNTASLQTGEELKVSETTRTIPHVAQKVSVTLYSSSRCTPCVIQKPILVAWCEDQGVALEKVSIDENPREFINAGFSSVPTMVFQKDGVRKVVVGLKTKEELQEILDNM